MAILDSLSLELQLTIAGILILLMVTLLQILSLLRARKAHRQNLEAIARHRAQPENKCPISTFSMVLQFIFGLTALAVFSLWTIYLVATEMHGLAAASGVAALVAVLMPFEVWLFRRQAGKETTQALAAAPQRSAAPEQAQPAMETPASKAAPVSFQADEAQPPAVEALKTPEPVKAAEPEPVKTPDAPAKPVTEASKAPAANYPKPDPAYAFPQDSMLRRHFMTHLASLTKPYEPALPSDSMLRRHYEAMRASDTQSGGLKPYAKAAVTVETAKPETSRCGKRANLPEDSMLKRHFVTHLKMKIEAGLSLQERPTDSMLRRHFDAMCSSLVNEEMRKYGIE